MKLLLLYRQDTWSFLYEAIKNASPRPVILSAQDRGHACAYKNLGGYNVECSRQVVESCENWSIRVLMIMIAFWVANVIPAFLLFVGTGDLYFPWMDQLLSAR